MTPGRGLHSDVTTELAKSSFTMTHLVKLELNSTYYYTDAIHDLTESGNTYLANGFLLAMDSVSVSSKMSTGAAKLTISAVNQTIISDVLTNGYIHKRVIIKRAYLNSSNNLISSNAVFIVYDGKIEGMSIKDTMKTSVIEFSIANNWAFFQRTAGRQTTSESQDQFFSDDVGFKFMSVSNS